MLRSIRRVVAATPNQAGNLAVLQPLPTDALPELDPFLLLHHIGPEEFPPYNDGLPFGPHPHRGFETVTLVLAGEVEHQDSRGNHGVVGAGGAQWMTAARGIIHAENLPRHMRQTGGRLELLQLWLNLPAARKMEQPHYQNLPAAALPSVMLAAGAELRVLAGDWAGGRGPAQSRLPGLRLGVLELAAGATCHLALPPTDAVLCYVVRGEVRVNEVAAGAHSLVEFGEEGQQVQLLAAAPATVLLGAAPPLREPVARQGPYVMNTTTQLMEALRDYQLGRMGVFIPII